MSLEITRCKTEVVEKTVEVDDVPSTDDGSKDAALQGTVSEEEGKYTQTHRGLKSRHIQLLALGGSIGTGLFVGTGSTLSLVGPAPLFLSFIVISAVVWVVVQALAEMTTYLPVQGASVPFYVNRYLCPSLAFAAGWNYWYSYAMGVAAEISAAGVLIGYWENPVPLVVWIALFLLTILALNIFAVSYYGESEFWFASIKILALIGLLILGLILFFGGGPTHDRLSFRYWSTPHSAFKSYPSPNLGATGKFLAFWTSLVRSGFAFVLGPELITIAAGETEAPRRNISRASKRFIYRLIIFYVLGILVITVIVPSDDPALLQAVSKGVKDANISPFVLGIKRARIEGLDHVINAVILTSAWSAGNSFLYAGSRSLYSLALCGQAPACFKRCSRGGVPYFAVAATAGVGCLTFLSVGGGGSVRVFGWFLRLCTVSGFVAWVVLLGAHLRFRKALIHHNLLHTLPYTSRGQPYITYIALGALILLTLTNGFQVFFPGNFSVASFFAAYATLPLFGGVYAGHRIWRWRKGGVGWRGWCRGVEDVEVCGGEEVEEEEVERCKGGGKGGWMRRTWGWVC